MYADWQELARLLADHPEIVIAKMDTDANEKDPYYLPETFVPNIKLFKKGDKRNYVPYSNGARTVANFLEFLGRETGLQLEALMASKYPAYRTAKNVDALLAETTAILQCYQPAQPERFLCDYFVDAEAFPPRKPASRPATATERVLSDPTLWTLAIEAGLKSSLPEDPRRFLAQHFFPRFVTLQDTHASLFGFKSLDRSGIEMLSPQAEFECWPDVTRAVSTFKVRVCVRFRACACVSMRVRAFVCVCVCGWVGVGVGVGICARGSAYEFVEP
jgi:hypothetical protein